METRKVHKGMNIHTRRAIAYVVLTIISFFCLFWFYILFVNATRSNGQLQSGFTLAPSSHLLENWKNLLAGTLPVWNGMLNSIIVAGLSALVSVYFSTMTAYAIHAYDFGLKKFIYPFILMIMMIPTQVTALGFIKLVTKMGMMDSFIPLIVPTIASPVVFFYMKQYMESALPLSLIEAARIDGSGEFRTFNSIVLPLMKPAIAVQAIFTFVSSWNNYFTPALILHDDKKKTLPILIVEAVYPILHLHPSPLPHFSTEPMRRRRISSPAPHLLFLQEYKSPFLSCYLHMRQASGRLPIHLRLINSFP